MASRPPAKQSSKKCPHATLREKTGDSASAGTIKITTDSIKGTEGICRKLAQVTYYVLEENANLEIICGIRETVIRPADCLESVVQ